MRNIYLLFLLYEQQTELSRGGTAVLSSMDAEDN